MKQEIEKIFNGYVPTDRETYYMPTHDERVYNETHLIPWHTRNEIIKSILSLLNNGGRTKDNYPHQTN